MSGPPVALMDLLQRRAVTPAELAKLREAESLSDSLATIEFTPESLGRKVREVLDG